MLLTHAVKLMNSMLLHNESTNKISVCNVISCLFEFVLGVAGHLLVLRRERSADRGGWQSRTLET